jgi:cupin fold WbuC family metalloprotein
MHSNLNLTKVSDEVFIASDPIVRLDMSAVDFIRDAAMKNARGRARICAHKKPTDTLHEMLIGIRADSYIRPHRHHNKVESFHLVEGAAEIVIFDEDGTLMDVIELSQSKNFYYRLDMPRYHTLLIQSPVLVIHEITNGPFVLEAGDAASFAPPEGDPTAVTYIEMLRVRATQLKQAESTRMKCSQIE